MKQNASKLAYKEATALCSALLGSALLMLLLVGCSAPAGNLQTPGSGLEKSSNDLTAQGSGTATNQGQEDVYLPSQVIVDVEVDCSEAVESGNSAAIAVATAGKMFAGQVGLRANETALDALQATGLLVVTKNSGTGVFVDSIAGLASGATGPISGWTYTLNGQPPTTSLDSIVPKDGDVLVFTYKSSL